MSQTKTQTSTENNNSYEPILDSAPVVKEYQKPNVDESSILEDIPTFNYQKPTMDMNVKESDVTDDLEQKSTNFSTTKKATEEPANPEYTDLSKKEKRIGAEMAADAAIGGYDFLCSQVLTPIALIKTQKIEEKIASGVISTEINFPLDEEGNEGNVRDYVKEFNGSITEAMAVSDKFKEEVREPLIRIAEKKGLAMTDEQFVAVALGKDLLTKSIVVFQMKSSTQSILSYLEERTLSERAINNPVSQPIPKTYETQNDVSTQSIPTIVPSEHAVHEQPKETIIVNDNGVAEKKSVVEKTSNFVEKTPVSGMPKFGDKEKLKHLDETFGPDGNKVISKRVATNSSRNKQKPTPPSKK